MKGIILAGGNGTRLRPVTYATPKHLLPVYNKPLIYFPLHQMKSSGITDVALVVNQRYVEHFKHVLGDGSALGLTLHYVIEDKTLGILYAVSLAHQVFSDDDICVMFGDNIFEDDITPFVKNFTKQKNAKAKTIRGARVALKEVPDPERFGVCQFDDSKNIIGLVEKPKHPPSNLALTGLFFADRRYYDIFKQMKPSARGEYEYPDFLNFYLREGSLQFDVLEGRWFDTGTFDSLLEASNFVKDHPHLKKEFFKK